MKMQKPLIEKIDGKYYDDGELVEIYIPDKTGWTKEQHLQHNADMEEILQMAIALRDEMKRTRKAGYNGQNI